MVHKMSKKVKNQFQYGRWYVDSEGDFHKFDFHKFDKFDGTTMVTLGCIIKGEFKYGDNCLGVGYFKNKCILMTLDDMKKHLPQEEWWIDPSNEFFPIY